MDKFSRAILRELLPAEKDVVPPAATKNDAENAVHHWSAALLLERAAYLSQMARHGDGSASETLKEYPQHCAMLSFRSRNGEAEVHENFADIFYVIEGRATLVTGGALAGAIRVEAGEIRASSVEGGKRQELRPGDVIHVPAGVPHQMLVGGEKTITCLVVKVQENS
jgi:mannose-6-phosphate isomerase-like protein (cupin superfamily)